MSQSAWFVFAKVLIFVASYQFQYQNFVDVILLYCRGTTVEYLWRWLTSLASAATLADDLAHGADATLLADNDLIDFAQYNEMFHIGNCGLHLLHHSFWCLICIFKSSTVKNTRIRFQFKKLFFDLLSPMIDEIYLGSRQTTLGRQESLSEEMRQNLWIQRNQVSFLNCGLEGFKKFALIILLVVVRKLHELAVIPELLRFKIIRRNLSCEWLYLLNRLWNLIILTFAFLLAIDVCLL